MEFLDGTEDAYDEVREERRAGFYPEDKEVQKMMIHYLLIFVC